MLAREGTLNRTMKFMLTLCGSWPGTSYVLFCRMFWVVAMTIVLFYNYRYLLTHMYTAELMDLVDCLCVFLAHSKVITKCVIFWLNQRKFVQSLIIMAEDWDDCANNDISLRETLAKAKLSDRIVNGIIILHTITVIGFGIGILLTDADVTDETIELPFVNKLEIPFTLSQHTYRFILITEILHTFMCSWTAGITNALLLTLTLHVAGQIDILCYWLKELVPNKNDAKHESIVGKIVRKHQKIIMFSDNIESLYTYIALMQFASNTILICLLGFIIIASIGSPNMAEQIVKSLLFYTITNLEAFIFCFAGEYLKNKSKEIGIAAYNSAWYNMKYKDNRFLLFVMLRSQRQLTLTIGKMMDLSLETFTRIMNSSGSYISMLLAVN